MLDKLTFDRHIHTKTKTRMLAINVSIPNMMVARPCAVLSVATP